MMNNLSMPERLDEIEKTVMSELKDFQRATVCRIDQLYKQGQNRVLVADEVGLGKTLIARGTIAKFAKLRLLKEDDDLVKVVYICSNANIAQQNLEKLKIVRDAQVANSNTSRLSMQHLNIFNEESDEKVKENYIQLIPLTPQTSFKLTNSQGLAVERALMYSILKHMDELKGFENKLSEFLRCGVKYWEGLIGYYDDEVNKCNNKSKNLDEKYLDFMCRKLSESFKNNDFITKLKEYLERDEFNCYESKPYIMELRKIFTEISLERLDPDLIIMDEFQRFRYLLESNVSSDMGLLIDKFFNNSENKDLRILLLSATPYKMYSTLDEINESGDDDHFKEFKDVINFLKTSEEEKTNFNTIWSNYSMKLKEISKDTDSFLLVKNEAEEDLYKNICRTERIAETNAAKIIDDSDKEKLLKVFKDDIRSYKNLEELLESIDGIKSVPIDYIKSSPYLMSFMNGYKLKDSIKDYFGKKPQEIYKLENETFWINKSDIDNYRKIEFNHTRLNYLIETVLKDKEELLLWVPPSKEYYPSEGAFKDMHNFSKTLIFSSWEMVPKMISTLVSYEVERRTIGEFSKDNPNIKYFKRDNKDNTLVNSNMNRKMYVYASPRIGYSFDKKGKPSNMSLLSLIYPSSYLSMVYVPIECLNDGLSLEKIEDLLRDRIKSRLDQFIGETNSHENYWNRNDGGDHAWYYLAPLLLDCLDEKIKFSDSKDKRSNLEWYDCTGYVENWFKKFKILIRNEKDRKNFEAHIKYLEDTFHDLVDYAKNENNESVNHYKDLNYIIPKLGRKPDDLLDVLVDIAIASPANCIYRSYRRELSTYDKLDLTVPNDNSKEYYSNERVKEALAKEMKKYSHLCSKLAFNFLNLMNAPEAMATIDWIYRKYKDPYWRKILTYSKHGNLQAVFDEYVYLLSNGLDKNNDKRINIIHEMFLDSMNLVTATYDVDTFNLFKSEIDKSIVVDEIEPKKLRTHFAVPFTKGVGNEVDTNRKTSVRGAFNSPFRPFVLASTSIGQEGLDFHNYCRRIVHWNLPSNPIDLEQREGRINRFASLAIRQNIAKRYGGNNQKFKNNFWYEMFEKAIDEEKTDGVSDLIPFWGLKESKDNKLIKIERILPFYPFSIDQEKYERLINILLVYRLTLGQPRQEELLDSICIDKNEEELKDLFINLSPFYKQSYK